jgi:hypothetical protein
LASEAELSDGHLLGLFPVSDKLSPNTKMSLNDNGPARARLLVRVIDVAKMTRLNSGTVLVFLFMKHTFLLLGANIKYRRDPGLGSIE